MDARVETAPLLRSLRIGEIFDRATTFFVRNFTVFTLISLTLQAPVGIVNFFVNGGGRDGDYTALIQQITHPMARTQTPALTSAMWTDILVVLIAALCAPFINNAIASGVADVYAGERPAYARAFALVFSRTLPLLLTILLSACVLIGLYICVFLTSVVVGFITVGFFAGGGSRSAFVPVLIAIAIVAVLAIFVAILVAIACAFALYATTLERFSPGKSISAGFARIFRRREIGKALLMTLAYAVLQIVVVIVTGGVALLLGSIPIAGPALEIAFSTIAGSVLSAFIAVLIAVYYFDVRTRAEGLDLEVELERLSPIT